MLNLYRAIFLLLILPLLILSCKESQEKVEQKKVTHESTVFEKKLVGSWENTSPAALDFTLFSDGTARSDNMATLLYKQWYVEGNTLYLVAESVGNKTWSVDTTGYFIEQLDEGQMKLKDKNRVLKYKRTTRSQNNTQNEKDQTTTEVKTDKGKLVLGHEARSFQPCGSEKVFWISDKTANLKQLYDELTLGEKPYTPIYAEIEYMDKGNASEGFPAEYESVYEVIKILKTEKVSDSNCK